MVGSVIGGHNIQIGSTTGDVVILLDRPDYRLEFLTPTPPEPTQLTARARRQPSYLLDPQHQVVPYTPDPPSSNTSSTGSTTTLSRCRCCW